MPMIHHHKAFILAERLAVYNVLIRRHVLELYGREAITAHGKYKYDIAILERHLCTRYNFFVRQREFITKEATQCRLITWKGNSFWFYFYNRDGKKIAACKTNRWLVDTYLR